MVNQGAVGPADTTVLFGAAGRGSLARYSLTGLWGGTKPSFRSSLRRRGRSCLRTRAVVGDRGRSMRSRVSGRTDRAQERQDLLDIDAAGQHLAQASCCQTVGAGFCRRQFGETLELKARIETGGRRHDDAEIRLDDDGWRGRLLRRRCGQAQKIRRHSGS